MRHPCRLILLALLCAGPVAAQMRTPGSGAVSEDSGPIGDDSGPVGEGSRSMHERYTIGESSGAQPDDNRTGGPVRDRNTRSMRSGPVASMSSGPMTQPRTLPDGGSMTENSAGAVKHDIDRPLGSRISEPLRELAPLQAQLRTLREHGSEAAIAAAEAPASAEPPPAAAAGEEEGELEDAGGPAEAATEEAPAADAPEADADVAAAEAAEAPVTEPASAPAATPAVAR
ncbi:MAG TPA: hypothetical protein VL049_00835 [Candidatus Dormibacteraeota bacterium]|nr:hypothetical protein [Candidatus Dormibacteraeota bacterium]